MVDLFTGLILSISQYFATKHFLGDQLYKLTMKIISIIPPISFSSCIAGFIRIAWDKNHCKMCETLNKECLSTIQKYFEFRSNENPYGMLEETLLLFFSSILYITIIFLFEHKIFTRLYQLGFNSIAGIDVDNINNFEDPDVTVERDYVKVARTRSHSSRNKIFCHHVLNKSN